MSDFFGPGQPVCAYHIGYLCFQSWSGVVTWVVVIGGSLLTGVVSGIVMWVRRR